MEATTNKPRIAYYGKTEISFVNNGSVGEFNVSEIYNGYPPAKELKLSIKLIPEAGISDEGSGHGSTYGTITLRLQNHGKSEEMVSYNEPRYVARILVNANKNPESGLAVALSMLSSELISEMSDSKIGDSNIPKFLRLLSSVTELNKTIVEHQLRGPETIPAPSNVWAEKRD